MEAWGLTDTGNVREENQDFYRMERLGPETLLAVVCDGMGGARAGNVASRLACEVFCGEVCRSLRDGMTEAEEQDVLCTAAKLANISVYEHAQLSEEFRGMGTTLVAALVRGLRVQIVPALGSSTGSGGCVGLVSAAVGSSVAGGSVGSSGSSPPCSAGPREQAASETASISAHSAEISFFISIILSSKIVKYVSECICSKPFYLFRRDFCASVPQILRFFFLGSTAQLQLRPSPNALAELCGAALVLTEKFYYNKGMFWKRMYGEDDCRVFFPGKTECARAARRTGGRGRAAERTGV